MQRWKTDPTLHSCPTEKVGDQTKKKIDYGKTYIEEFLNKDPLRDWESINRCQHLWMWCMTNLYDRWPYELPKTWKILDCGTKDGQFPAWLRETEYEQSMGIEISGVYVDYAKELGRPVAYGDVCNMDVSWTNNFDFVFSHHLHGLTPDYLKALEEMYRVTNKYMVALNDVPGNKRKHYSYIDSPDIFHKFVEDNPCEVIHNDYLETGFGKEWVIFIKKVS
jgi:SAM-dependent methyltransferase